MTRKQVVMTKENFDEIVHLLFRGSTVEDVEDPIVEEQEEPQWESSYCEPEWDTSSC